MYDWVTAGDRRYGHFGLQDFNNWFIAYLKAPLKLFNQGLFAETEAIWDRAQIECINKKGVFVHVYKNASLISSVQAPPHSIYSSDIYDQNKFILMECFNFSPNITSTQIQIYFPSITFKKCGDITMSIQGLDYLKPKLYCRCPQ